MSRDPAHTPETPAVAAARWFAKRRSGEMTEVQARAFAAWLDADPANRDAYNTLRAAWRDVEPMRDDPRIMSLRAAALEARPRRDTVLRLVAASLAEAVVGAGVLIGSGVLADRHAFSDQSYRTGVGQRASVNLPDGSTVTLNTDSVLRTRADHERRLVYLDRGQAFFHVAKDRAHPFIVAAAGRTVTAVGTAFDVRVDAKQFEVTLVEGKVRVEQAPSPASAKAPRNVQATEMIAGTQLRAVGDQTWSLSQADTGKETSWLSGELVVYAQPLRDVVAELNRYSDRKIVIDDPKVALRPISGAFKTGDVDTFVRGLEMYRIARVEAETDGAVRLAGVDGASAEKYPN